MEWKKRIKEWLWERSGMRGYVCDYCEAELFNYPQQRFCKNCEDRLLKNADRVCGKCGRRTHAEGICGECKHSLPAFTQGFSPFEYRGETASIINVMKTEKPRLAHYFGEKMATYFLQHYTGIKRDNETGGYEMNCENILLIPVPISDKKRISRGFNQSELLARAVYRVLSQAGLDVEIDFDLLWKQKENEEQKHMSVQGRKQNVEGAYHVHKRKKCRGRTILLIDDILTTGATSSECALRLFGAGAKEVLVLTTASLCERKR